MSNRSNLQASKKLATAHRVPVEGRQSSKDLPQPSAPSPALLQTLVDHPAKLSPGDFLNLQRTVGNTIVRRLLAQGHARRAGSDAKTSLQIQTKLTVGAADDPFEREADRVAAQLMSIPDSSIKSSATTPVRRRPEEQKELQRSTEEDEVPMKPLVPDISPLLRRQFREESGARIRTLTKSVLRAEGTVQAKGSVGESFEVNRHLERRISATRGGGSPLPQSTRDFMEPRFGSDFSAVRVHTNTEAAQMNRTLSAHAFTHGTDIYMGEGKYNPGSDAGKAILAHELTHVVQQTGRSPRTRSAGTPPQAPVVNTVTRLRRKIIQRQLWKNNPTQVTREKSHPALANIGLAGLTPYKFDPMAGTFEFVPPAVPVQNAEVLNFLKYLVKYKQPGKQFHPEKIVTPVAPYNWHDPIANVNRTFHAINAAPDPADRVKKASDLYLKHKHGAGNKARIVGKVLDGIRNHNGGATPRPFRNITQEDNYGHAAGAHIRARHVLGSVEMPDEEAVAIRAAFGRLGGQAWGAAVMYSKTASAFRTVADANKAIGKAISDEWVKNWDQHRDTLLTDGGVTLKVNMAAVNKVAYKSTGAKWGANQKPTYIWGAAAGQKPLFYPNVAWTQWTVNQAMPALQVNALKATPLTTDVSATVTRINVRILSSETTAHGGWFIHSAYPIV